MTELPFCECGECGLRVTKPGNRFIKGHNGKDIPPSDATIAASIKACKGIPFSDEHKLKLSKVHTGVPLSDDHCKAISRLLKGKPKSSNQIIAMREGSLKEKDPLPEGYKINIPLNKDSPVYLGIISEKILSEIFKNVTRMPYGNHGYDIICDLNYKIDIKSSATGYKGYWLFSILKNEIADYFLCIAFEDRNSLIPIHLWLIPGKDANHKTTISISKSTIFKWTKYEQPLDKVILCCNEMR